MPARLAFLTVFALLGLIGAGFARASVTAFDTLSATLGPSAAPVLLGPINESGRNGWQCAPEQAAKARRAGEADLPQPGGP